MEKLVLRRLLGEVGSRLRMSKLPDDYVVFDTETTDVNPFTCRAVQYGLTFVKGRKRVGNFVQVVKLPDDVVVSPGAAAIHGITRERMNKEGCPPAELIPMLVEMFKTWRKDGALFVGHNAMAFDIHIFHRDVAALKLDFRFGDDEIVDTGMLVKAGQLSMSFGEGDTLSSFYAKVSRVRAKGVHWSLDRYCYSAFNLAKYVGGNFKAHDAGADCDMTHYLFEELRTLAGDLIAHG